MVRQILVCCAIFGFLVGCSTEKPNVVGGEFIGRNAGEAVALPSIPLRSGRSFQELVFPTVMGEAEELLVGQMNGFMLQSLLRFKVHIDELASETGGVPEDLVVDSLRVVLGIRDARFATNTSLIALKPEADWAEIQGFVDSLTLQEAVFPSSEILGANTLVDADRVLIELPASYLNDLRVAEADSPAVDLLVQPLGSGEFLLDLFSRESIAAGGTAFVPVLEVVYNLGDVSHTATIESTADTYWSNRINGGPPEGLLLLSEGMFYGTSLDFTLPGNIPTGATINSAKLEFDIDLERSFFSSLAFEIYHLEFVGTPTDTIFTRYNTPLLAEPTKATYTFNQSLIQAWMSGAQVNQGLALSPLGLTSSSGLPTLLNNPPRLRWIVFNDVRLNIVYSLPPEL